MWLWNEIWQGLVDIAQGIFVRPRYDEPIEQHPMNMPPEAPKPPVVPPKPTPPPVVFKRDLLNDFCTAIRDYEGGPGDRNYRNNNPGNCRYSSVGYLPMYGPVRKDAQNFAIFKDYATGWLYLKNPIKSKVAKHPDQTIFQFMQVYAPTGDDNNPRAYSIYIAHRLGVTIDYKMKDIV